MLFPDVVDYCADVKDLLGGQSFNVECRGITKPEKIVSADGEGFGNTAEHVD